MSDVLEADPEVCQAVDRLSGSATTERRRCAREPFPVVQQVARATGQKVPEQSAFFPVKCRDLSTRGFSFVLKRRPQFTSLVLALDAPPEVIYLAAEVRHCTEVLVHPSGRVEPLPKQDPEAAAPSPGGDGANDGAKVGVLVGCEFTERLEVRSNRPSATG